MFNSFLKFSSNNLLKSLSKVYSPFILSGYILTILSLFGLNLLSGWEFNLTGLGILLVGLVIIILILNFDNNFLNNLSQVDRKSIFFAYIVFLSTEILTFTVLFISYLWLLGNVGYTPVNQNAFTTIDYYSNMLEYSNRALPLIGTSILALSAWFTLALEQVFINKKSLSNKTTYNLFVFLVCAILTCGISFSVLQLIEFNHFASFNTSIVANFFYAIIGLHFSHIIIGSILFIILLIQNVNVKETLNLRDNLLFNIAIIYWHFVDAVWIVVFYFIYIQGISYLII